MRRSILATFLAVTACSTLVLAAPTSTGSATLVPCEGNTSGLCHSSEGMTFDRRANRNADYGTSSNSTAPGNSSPPPSSSDPSSASQTKRYVKNADYGKSSQSNSTSQPQPATEPSSSNSSSPSSSAASGTTPSKRMFMHCLMGSATSSQCNAFLHPPIPHSKDEVESSDHQHVTRPSGDLDTLPHDKASLSSAVVQSVNVNQPTKRSNIDGLPHDTAAISAGIVQSLSVDQPTKRFKQEENDQKPTHGTGTAAPPSSAKPVSIPEPGIKRTPEGNRFTRTRDDDGVKEGCTLSIGAARGEDKAALPVELSSDTTPKKTMEGPGHPREQNEKPSELLEGDSGLIRFATIRKGYPAPHTGNHHQKEIGLLG
ncbi:hypothetical protein JAAARDRAFT_208618 [Jaapia argillacea MUCL 33604]|uniref:Secreted protein n=1 Tax=Jaapia argillacea MUCL 33604 TaxID=933084 RepID=A0A067PPW7_9AGAM|nr:hypothetical protein JAAARDRAFT_208618 [Jaapia argillacea MUCL 33604]